MAQRTTVQHFDDLDGSPIEDNDQPTVRFSLDGTSYEIDLGDDNRQALRDALAPYIGAARRLGGRKTIRVEANARTVKEWARANGYAVADRGRVSKEIRKAFEAANN